MIHIDYRFDPFPDVHGDPEVIREQGPAWRWRLIMDWRKCSLDKIDTHPANDDPLLRRYVLPWLKWQRQPGRTLTWQESHEMDLYKQVWDWYDNAEWDPKRIAYRIEANFLAGRQAAQCDFDSERRPATTEVRLYEALFFDVQPILEERDWILFHLFIDPFPVTPIGGWGLRAKLLSYALGFDEYRGWRKGRRSRKTGQFLALLEEVLAMLRGLKHLNTLYVLDPFHLFHWLFRQADRLKVGEPLLPFPDDELLVNSSWELHAKQLPRIWPGVQIGPIRAPERTEADRTIRVEGFDPSRWHVGLPSGVLADSVPAVTELHVD